jgi:cytochrome b subunit of formate dehydrogenase
MFRINSSSFWLTQSGFPYCFQYKLVFIQELQWSFLKKIIQLLKIIHVFPIAFMIKKVIDTIFQVWHDLELSSSFNLTPSFLPTSTLFIPLKFKY